MDYIKTPVKGMCDMLPSDMRLRNRVLGMIRENYARYGFMEIETPVMEHIENLTSKQGGDNEKLIFKVLKRGRDLEKAMAAGGADLADNGLRYDLTVPLARYYANNREKLPAPFKALQTGNVWRADNPQKGRFRQFVQCDIDILGDETNLAEIELLAASCETLTDILSIAGITDFTVHVNDRRILSAAVTAAGFSEEDVLSVLITLDKLDKIGAGGVKKELLDNGFAEENIDRFLAEYDGTEGIGLEEFCGRLSNLDPFVVQNLREILDSTKVTVPGTVSVIFDPTLVRGMGYYTGPIFEITMDGYNFSVSGGGRYDNMVGNFCGQPVPATGISIGFERIITIMAEHMEKKPSIDEKNLAILLDRKADSEMKINAFREAKELRDKGYTVTVQPMRKNMKQQIDRLMDEGFTEFKKVYKQ